MSKLNIQAVLDRKHLFAKDVALKFYGCSPDADEKQVKSKAVMFSNMFMKNANPTYNTLQKLADVLEVDIIQLFDSSDTDIIDYTSPETGKRYKMIPIY